MRAIVADRCGGPEVLELREIERPAPGPGQVLVRIIASGTNPVDTKLRKDWSWAGLTPPVILGADASGVVEALGAGVTDLAVGDDVYYTPEIIGNTTGTYAEYEAVAAAIVARKPRSLTHEQAAAVPLAGGTAWEAVVRRLELRVGQTILIHGGAGGVGSFAVQIARASGARVLATAGADNQALLRELGAHVAIDYRADDPVEVALRETGGAGVDAVFDTAGVNLHASFRATRRCGRLATILGAKGDLQPAYGRNLEIHGVFLIRERRRLDEMAAAIDLGHLRPIVDQVMPLADVRRAHERLESGHGRGKIVLQVAPA